MRPWRAEIPSNLSSFAENMRLTLCTRPPDQETSLESSLDVSVDVATRHRARVLKELREPLKPKPFPEALPPPRPAALSGSA